MQAQQQFINLEKSVLTKILSKDINHYDIAVYTTLCAHSTFKHKVFGVYSKQSYQSLQKLILQDSKENKAFDKQVLQTRRSVEKLQKHMLLKVLTTAKDTSNLIISLDAKQGVDYLKNAMENSIEDFNIYAKRISEVEAALSIQLKIVEEEEKLKIAQSAKEKAQLEEKEDLEDIEELFYKHCNKF